MCGRGLVATTANDVTELNDENIQEILKDFLNESWRYEFYTRENKNNALSVNSPLCIFLLVFPHVILPHKG